MISGKAYLTVAAVGAALGGGTGLEIGMHEKQSSQLAYRTAEGCNKEYPPTSEGNISDPALQCMQQGWMPGGRTINTAEMKDGDGHGYSVIFLDEYIKIQKDKARSIRPSEAILGAILGGTLALIATSFIGMSLEKDEEERRRTAKKREEESDQAPTDIDPIASLEASIKPARTGKDPDIWFSEA